MYGSLLSFGIIHFIVFHGLKKMSPVLMSTSLSPHWEIICYTQTCSPYMYVCSVSWPGFEMRSKVKNMLNEVKHYFSVMVWNQMASQLNVCCQV